MNASDKIMVGVSGAAAACLSLYSALVAQTAASAVGAWFLYAYAATLWFATQ